MAFILFALLMFVYICNAEVHELSDDNFDEMTSTGLWYLEFYAPWWYVMQCPFVFVHFFTTDCHQSGHCKKFAPIYEEAAEDSDLQKIKFGAIDATSQKDIAQRFGVSRFPTIKFYENTVTFKYSGSRTLESLKKEALKMLEPVIKEFEVETFNKLNNRFAVQFLYIANDQNTQIEHPKNLKKFQDTANKFRPDIIFYAIDYSKFQKQFLSKSEFIQKSLKMNADVIKKQFVENGGSVIYAITPSIKNSAFIAEKFDENDLKKFIERNRYSPVIEMKLGNYKTLVENSNFFGIIFVNGQNEKLSKNALKLIGEAETMMIENGEWNIQSVVKYDQAKMENSEDESIKMYELIMSYCNATQYEEWASHTFGLKESELPLMVVYSPKEDGYWKYDEKQMKMVEFVENVFLGKLEITYVRSWIARQGIKLEKWLNSLNTWQLPLLFVGIFGGLCAVMVGLDYCCAPEDNNKKID